GEPFAWGTKLVTGKATGAGSQFVTNPLPLVSLLIYPSVNRVFLGSAIPLVPEPIVFALELDVGQELNGFMCREGFPIRFCRWRLQRGGGIEHSLGSSLQGLAVSEDPADHVYGQLPFVAFECDLCGGFLEGPSTGP